MAAQNDDLMARFNNRPMFSLDDQSHGVREREF